MKPLFGRAGERSSKVPGPPRTSDKAVGSLMLGLLFYFCVGLSGPPAVVLGVLALREIDRSEGQLRGRELAGAGIALGVVGCLLAMLLVASALLIPRESELSSLCCSNLKQIALALHDYEQDFGRLPPAAVVDGAGRPLLSWRVAILPYVGAGALHAEFRLNEPWDSPHNLKLLGAMPDAFGCPSEKARKSGMTGYRVVVGPRTPFPPDFRPVSTAADFPDGAGKTAAVVESPRLVPWTKPDEIPFASVHSRDALGSRHVRDGKSRGNLFAAFADGSVRFLHDSVHPRVLRALTTRNGNEKVRDDDF